MAEQPEILHLPNATTTMRCFRGSQGGRPAIVFMHGLLGDGHQWDRLDTPCRPRDYADAYYIDYHFEQRRASALTFRELVQETVAMLKAGPGLNHPQLALVGSSFGGHMALYLDAFRLATPRQLILFAPGGTRRRNSLCMRISASDSRTGSGASSRRSVMRTYNTEPSRRMRELALA